jgi:uncharacterized GH25 family protein
MRKVLCALACALLMAAAAEAHFVFVVPSKDAAVTVVFSEELEADEGVDIGKVAGLKLTCRDAAGKDVPVTLKTDKHSLTAALPGSGARVVFGSVPYGVMQKGDAKPFLLVYHPKALVGPVAAEKSAVGDKLPAELIPVVEAGKVRFKLVAAGKPVADAEVTVLKPDGSKAKVKAGRDGLTDAVEGSGRFGAWVRYTEPKAGEHSGKKYDEVRHYATLVADIGNR